MFKKIIFVLIAFTFGQFAYAQDFPDTGRGPSTTIDVKYQEEDTGRYWVDNVLQQQLRELNNTPSVLNLRIPLPLGIKVSNLRDTWGDARSNGRTHEGIDIIAPRGSLIVSPTDAVVTTVANSGNGGKHVFTSNPGGDRYYFAHLDNFIKGLMEGQVLKAGDPIGYVGNTGNARGGVTHLHFGIYKEKRGGAINPFPRLTLTFSLKDAINSVRDFLNISDNTTVLARNLTGLYRTNFNEAQASNISLPASITRALLEKTVPLVGISRTLQLGSNGEDVKSLQSALGLPADGSFGQKTKAAVIAFQISKGLTADGVFGSRSRALLGNIITTNVPSGADCSPAGPVCPNGKTYSSNCMTSC